MKIDKVLFDENTFGNTQASLKALRDTLAERRDNRIIIMHVPTRYPCFGYMIFDADQQIAVFTGDGFREDNLGEGGAGYRSARVLLKLYYGTGPKYGPSISLDEAYIFHENGRQLYIERRLLSLANEIAGELAESEYIRPRDTVPYY
jgi:hypothetical protein